MMTRDQSTVKLVYIIEKNDISRPPLYNRGMAEQIPHLALA